MEVSSFELIYKPQSPSGAADTVLQGYFLNITNLEDTQLTFQVNFVTSSVTDADRSLANNTIAFIDTPNVNNTPATLVGGLTAPSFVLNPSVTIAPNETAKIAVLPSDPFPAPVGPANFEARGYVKLRLRPVIVFDGVGISLQPQLDRPARVLLTPQNRATYFDVNGDINDQTQAGLPTGSGAAIDEVEPESFFSFLPGGGFSASLAELQAAEMPEFEERDLAMMLMAVSASDLSLREVNASLKKAGVGMALEKRKL